MNKKTCITRIIQGTTAGLIMSFSAYASDIEDYTVNAILEGLNGRDCLVGEKELVFKIQDAAKKKEIPLFVIPLSKTIGEMTNNEWMTDAVRMAAGDKRISNAAEFGPVPFARAMMRFNPEEASRRIASLVLPELWESEGIRALPSGLLFFGTKTETLSVETLLSTYQTQKKFWDSLGEAISSPGTRTAGDAEWFAFLRRQSSWNANNLGVALEQVGEKEKAYESYSRARLLYPGNISALLNRAVMIKRGTHPEYSEQVGRELGEIQNSNAGLISLWNLAQTNGEVFAPEEFFQFGWFWAASGVSCADTGKCEAVIAKIPESETTARRMLSDSWIMQSAGSGIFVEIAEDLENPEKRAEAAYAAATTFMLRGDLDTSDKWADIAEEAGVSANKSAIHKSTTLLLRKKRTEAKSVLIKAISKLPDSSELGTALVSICYEDQDIDTIRDFLAEAEKKDSATFEYPVLLAKGIIELFDGKYGVARDKFSDAIRLNPSLSPAYDLILPLDMQMDDRKAAESHADALLAIVQGHPFANYIKGSNAFLAKDYKNAEKYFMKSLSSKQTLAALNDYACLLLEMKRPAEAERIAITAIESDGAKIAAVWDTLAMAQMAQNKFDEADKSLDEASKLDGSDNPEIQLHLGQSLLRRGDVLGAKKAADISYEKRYLMDPSKRDELMKLRKELNKLPAL